MSVSARAGGRLRLPSDLAVALLWLYGSIWFALVLFQNWVPAGLSPAGGGVSTLLLLSPPGSRGGAEFGWWQLVSAHFVHEPREVMRFLFAMVGIWFFVRPLQQMLGFGRVLGIWIAAAVGAVAGALLWGVLQHPTARHGGVEPGVIAALVIFCERIPHAVIRLFFVIPVEARWVGRGAALITVLLALALPDAVGGWDVGGLAAAWAWDRWGGDPTRWVTRWRARRVVRRIAKFNVIEGGKGPTWH
jgi:membrane associated rhomboid family serine protease